MAQEKTIISRVEKPAPRRMLPALLFVALIISMGTTVYFYMQVAQLKKNPQQVAQQEVQQLVDRVSKLIVLPDEETPTVATVSDPEKLKDQPFFAKAQKGDRVLIYTDAKKAILYNPTTNKIVDVAPINIGNTSATTPPAEKKITSP